MDISSFCRRANGREHEIAHEDPEELRVISALANVSDKEMFTTKDLASRSGLGLRTTQRLLRSALQMGSVLQTDRGLYTKKFL
jgi:hypothetical protein